jgi:hypothetical protein
VRPYAQSPVGVHFTATVDGADVETRERYYDCAEVFNLAHGPAPWASVVKISVVSVGGNMEPIIDKILPVVRHNPVRESRLAEGAPGRGGAHCFLSGLFVADGQYNRVVGIVGLSRAQ